MPEVNTFQARVKNAIKGSFAPCMRRPLQSVVLYEADRSLGPRYRQLRPFQKKYALVSTAMGLLKTLDFLNEYHRQEVMFRTNASKEPLAPDLAWRRMKLITREINHTIVPKVKALLENEENKGKSHEDICALLLQKMYEENSGTSKPHPPLFEYNHNNAFLVYRVYYRGCAVDPNLFPATPSYVQVPLKKPPKGAAPFIPLGNVILNPKKVITPEERRAMLQEVKDHTELLREFEGVISDEELAKRKRALYAALPSVPPPSGAGPDVGELSGGTKQKKKSKVEGTAAAAGPAKAVTMEEEGDDWEKSAPAKNVASV